ncbi:hypothetical protein OC834_000334, partial [Tilletia horrida]
MLKSLRRKKTREGAHNSISSSFSGRTSTSNASQSGRNFLGDVIVISTAENNAPLAPPPTQGLSPSPPSNSNPFARPPKPQSNPNSTHTSILSHGDGPPSLGMGDKLLPDESNFRSSLILPHLERRFSLMNTISPEAMRSQLRAQRARAQENKRPFLTEEEEEEIISQLQVRIEANAKARGDVVPGKGKLGILLPPINDHPWDSVIERGTDGFGGHIPIYAAPAAEQTDGSAPAADRQPPLHPISTQVDPSSDNQLSPTAGAAIDSPPSPARRENDDRAVGSLFSSRGARADAAYMRNVAKQRVPKSVTPSTHSGADAGSAGGAHMSTGSSELAASSSGIGKPQVEPPQIKIGRESILSSSRSSTSSNRPSMSALQMSPSQPAINIVSGDDADHSNANASAGLDTNASTPSIRNQMLQRQSRLLTTLSPEAFRRVSTALDELFDHFRAEAGVSPVDDESEAHQALGERAPEVLHETPEMEEQVIESQDATEDAPSTSNTAPLSIRHGGSTDEAKGDEDEMRAFGEGPGIAMPGGFGFPASFNSFEPASQFGGNEMPSATRSSSMAFPAPEGSTAAVPRAGSTRSRNSISSTNPLTNESAALSPPIKHSRTFSVDSHGSSVSSMARYGLTPPTLPAKRTSSLPKRERKAAKEREAAEAKAASAVSPQLSTMSEKQRGKQREGVADSVQTTAPAGAETSAASAQSGGDLTAGIGGLTSAIGSGAMAVAAATTAALTPAATSTTANGQSADSDADPSGQRYPTPRSGSAKQLPPVPDSQPSPSFASLPTSPPSRALPPPPPTASFGGAFAPRPPLDHTRGASTFSQMSFTSADSFQSAEEGGMTSGGSVGGAKSSDEGSLNGRGSIGSHAFEMKPDPLNLGLDPLQPVGASLTTPQTLGLRGRAPSAAGSFGTASGRGSFVDDEIEPDDEDAFRYDRRATLRPAPRSSISPGSGSPNETAHP